MYTDLQLCLPKKIITLVLEMFNSRYQSLQNVKTASRAVCRYCSDSAIIIVSSAYSKV